jgi:hypothetical protein
MSTEQPKKKPWWLNEKLERELNAMPPRKRKRVYAELEKGLNAYRDDCEKLLYGGLLH